jgi:RHS repeat-associated protein
LTTSLTHADATGSVVTREPSGRIERVTTPWWSNVLTYFPTTGQVQSLTRGGQRLEWRYDGFLMKEEKALGIAPATSTWSYDSDFRVMSHGINGAPLAIQYDDDSALLGVGPVSLTRVPATGQLASVGVGSVVTSVAFNGYGETSSRSVPSLYSEALTFDAAGRIVLVNEVVEGVASQFVYTNDSQGRLTSVATNGATPTTWTYSPHGNRLTESGVPSTYDAQDRLLSRGATTYTWDAMGSRLSMTSGGQTTQYVHEGRALKSVTLPDRTVVAYEYDGRQRRVARTRNGVVTARWVYDGQYRVVAEVDAAGAVITRFVYASEGHSPDAMVRGGVTYAYVKNHLGTVKLVVNAATGAVVQRIESDSWGNVLSDSNPGFQPFIFAGGVFDNDTRLTHFGFRDYDSSSGSWMAPEPLSRSPSYVAGSAFRAISVPTYAYALNNPLRYVDSSGLWVDAVFDLERGVITLTDPSTGASISALAWSGISDDPKATMSGPIPSGEYTMFLRTIDSEHYITLDANDSNPGDDIEETTGRSNFRLHVPGASLGCIAIGASGKKGVRPKGDMEAWEAIRSFIYVRISPYDWGWHNGKPKPKLGKLTVLPRKAK